MKMSHKLTSRKKFICSRDNEIALITEVRERPQLWDPSHQDYAKTHKKLGQWEEIAEKLGIYFNASIVKERFDNMRTTFQRNHNKDSMRSGKGTDDIFEPKWDLYALLTFLKKSCTQANSISNLSMRDESVDSQQTYSDIESCPILLEEDRDVYFDETLQQWVLIPNDTQPCDKYSKIENTTVPAQQTTNPQVTLPKSSIPQRPTSASGHSSTVSVENTNAKHSSSNANDDELFVKRGEKVVLQQRQRLWKKHLLPLKNYRMNEMCKWMHLTILVPTLQLI